MGFQISTNNLEISNMENQKYLKMTAKELEHENNLTRLTPENSQEYLGFEIVFNTRGNNILKKINRVSQTGKTLYIDHPDLRNNLEIVGRKVYAINTV
jgi:hypothetical protein